MESSVTTQNSSTPGRRRSDRAHQAILQATFDLLVEGGYDSLTIEAIAARAGVGKKTIYRWWSSKAALALELLAVHAETYMPFQDTGSLSGDLLAYFARSFPALRDETGELLHGLVAEAQLDPGFAREFRENFIVPRRKSLVALLERGVQRGELAAGTNLEVLGDMVYGAKWYRFLLYPAPLDEEFAQSIVDLVLRLKG